VKTIVTVGLIEAKAAVQNPVQYSYICRDGME